jgi:hypothetical protein
MNYVNLTVKEIRKINLSELIRQSGQSKTNFAARIDTAPSYISQILSSRSKRGIGDEFARKIELCFQKPKGWMDGIHDDRANHQESSSCLTPNPIPDSIGAFEAWNDLTPHRKVAELDVAIPFLKGIEASDGHGGTRISKCHDQKLRLAKSVLNRAGVAEQHAFCITITSNNMEPVLPEGSVIVIDSSHTCIQDGDIYVIDHSGLLRVCCLYQLPVGEVRLRSYNSAEWPDELYNADGMDQVRILGRVFWWSVLR